VGPAASCSATSGVKHSLASTAYNTRRQECESRAAAFQQHNPAIQTARCHAGRPEAHWRRAGPHCIAAAPTW
jgi:galactokinase